MDLCTIEIVQIEGIAAEEASTPPTPANSAAAQLSIKLNMYLILFSKPKDHKSTPETIELFNSI